MTSMAFSPYETFGGNVRRTVAKQLDDVLETIAQPLCRRSGGIGVAPGTPVRHQNDHVARSRGLFEQKIAFPTELAAPLAIPDPALLEQRLEKIVFVQEIAS